MELCSSSVGVENGIELGVFTLLANAFGVFLDCLFIETFAEQLIPLLLVGRGSAYKKWQQYKNSSHSNQKYRF